MNKKIADLPWSWFELSTGGVLFSPVHPFRTWGDMEMTVRVQNKTLKVNAFRAISNLNDFSFSIGVFNDTGRMLLSDKEPIFTCALLGSVLFHKQVLLEGYQDAA